LAYSKCASARPRSIVENAALVSFESKEKTMKLAVSKKHSERAGALMGKLTKSSAVSTDEVHVYEVRTATITDLLAKHDIDEIDLWSLDVEGFELEVLAGMDFARFRPKFVLIECTGTVDKVHAVMAGHGYVAENGGKRINTWERERGHADFLWRDSRV
jgi:FkbM family methyltransferase